MDINTRLHIHTPFVTTEVKDRDPGKNYYFHSQQKRPQSQTDDDKGNQDNGPDDPKPLIDILA